MLLLLDLGVDLVDDLLGLLKEVMILLLLFNQPLETLFEGLTRNFDLTASIFFVYILRTPRRDGITAPPPLTGEHFFCVYIKDTEEGRYNGPPPSHGRAFFLCIY